MKEADTIGADKYFHCKANYEAAKRGWVGMETSKSLSFAREVIWYPKEAILHGPTNAIRASRKDFEANNYGRGAALEGRYQSAKDACAIFRPEGLNDKY